MRVDVSPRSSVAEPGRTLPITVLVTNTGDLIGGYTLRVLGADPSWVQLDTDQLSLFPGTSQTVLVNLTIPEGIAAGEPADRDPGARADPAVRHTPSRRSSCTCRPRRRCTCSWTRSPSTAAGGPRSAR